jgi:ATP-dependent helicase/DNAse subunit B
MKTAVIPEIQKTAEDVAKIKGTVLSATSLQSYLACPAKFYYNTVKELSLEEEVAESLDYGMFGTVFHDVMRAIYTSPSAMAEGFFFDHMEADRFITENEQAGNTVIIMAPFIEWVPLENCPNEYQIGA